jgi:hypothetical protein
MGTLIIRTLAGIVVLLLFLPLGASPDNSAWAAPFRMRIVDDQTGQGLRHVRLTSDNGIVCFTRTDGSVLWSESALMNRDVSFRIEAPGGQSTVTIRVVQGGHAEVVVRR